MGKDVTLTIDGIEVTVPEGTLVVNAAKKIGIGIPVFCYHPKMEPVGMCRMCLVEIGRPVIDRATGEVMRDAEGAPKIQFGPKLETACTTPVSAGMVVANASEKARAGREEILEFLLTSHPLDCPICDKGGECPLQNLTMEFGPGESRFLYSEKMHLAKHVPLGEMIFLDRERCIQCARCVRFQDEVVDDPVIGFYQRGRSLEIVTFSEPGFDSYFSGNTTDICPVGALTTADFRFRARPWELNAAASVCNHCPVGCSTTLNVRREAVSGGNIVVKRVMPRQNEQVNEIWICDKGRFGYHYTDRSNRLMQPLVRMNGELTPVSWDEALTAAAGGLQAAGKELLTVVGGRLANEDLFNLHQLTASLQGEPVLYSDMAGGDLTAQVGLGVGTNLAALGPETTVLVVACDLEEEAPLYWLRLKQAAERGVKLIVANPRPTKLDKFAQIVLRYSYGSEAAAVLALLNSLSAKRPNLPESVQALLRDPELAKAAQVFAEAENGIVVFGSEGASFESSQALAQACANLLISTNHTGRANNGLLGVWSRANDQGAWDVGFRPIKDLPAALISAKAVYLAAVDLVGDDPSLAEYFGPGKFVVVQELALTATARLADVVLPVQAFTEREGTLTSGERRVQRFYPAVPEPLNSLPDFAVTGQIGQRLGLDLESKFTSRLLARLAASIPGYNGLTYQKLAAVEPQWPIIARGDLFYGGTTYENSQGTGVQLSPTAQRGKAPTLGWIQPPELERLPDDLERVLSLERVHSSERLLPLGVFLAVPVSRLYDRGNTLVSSKTLQPRLPSPYVVLNQDDARRMQVAEGDKLEVTVKDITVVMVVRLEAGVPQGIILAPRSLGLPIHGPVIVQVKAFQPVLAG